MAGRLDGLTAVVTGAGRGHGRGIALTLAREGAKVVVADVGTSAFGDGADARPAQQVVDEIAAEGGEAIANFGDITDFEQAGQMVNTAIEAWGKLDILVNVAGTIRLCTITDITQEDWDSQIAVHMNGYFNTTHHAALHWVTRREYGRLINFSGGAGIWEGNPTILSYCAAKAGVVGFTRACANELAAYNVTANTISPHGTTPMADAVRRDTNQIVPVPDGKRGSELAVGTDRDPIHAAPLIVFLASPRAAHISGRIFSSYGGRYALVSEPREEREVCVNFLEEPDRLYAELEETLAAGLSLRDLPWPLPPLDRLGEDWRERYGARGPVWQFDETVAAG